MAPFILDCSVTMSWCFEDRACSYGDFVLKSLIQTHAFVPMLWSLEVSNVLLLAEKRGKIKESESAAFCENLKALPIKKEDIFFPLPLDLTHLGRQHNITSYDACYLFLALIKNLPLATLDERLKKAAQATGISLFA